LEGIGSSSASVLLTLIVPLLSRVTTKKSDDKK
jgi:hypothetical protein